MKSVASLLLLAGAAAGQQSAYGQCGGTGYSGPSSCVSGYACTSYNPYYYQCVPGTATSAAATTSKTSSTVKTTSTTSSAKTSSTSSVKTSTSSTTKATSSTKTSTTTGPTATGFAKTNGLMFEIDGVTKYFAGTNCYCASHRVLDFFFS